MHRATSTKIANQHSQTTPGWVVHDSTPNEWIEHVIKPLLADLTTPAPRFEPHQDRQSGSIAPSARSTDPNTQFIGWIYLASDAKTYHYPHSRHRYGGHSLMVPLYWIDASDGSHQVAIAPQRIDEHGYYYALSKLDELRYLANPEGLQALLEALLEGLRQQAFKEQKADKVRNLQIQAVQAQVRRIANEQQFAFQVATTARLIQIAVRLDENNQLTISVPFTEFEKVLPQLREVIVNLRALHQRRIRFRTHQCAYGSSSWIEPEPLPDVDPVSS